MAQTNGGPIIVAALILGAAFIAAALLLRAPIERTADGVASMQQTLASLQNAAAPAPTQRPAATGRPDPSRRYAVDTDGSPVRGASAAKLAVIEFSDFQCPFCSRVTPTLKEIEKQYGDKVRVVFKHLPLGMHAKAPAAHAAAEAAHRQGKFWEMHDLIFANQAEMSEAKYVEYAKQIGLDVAKFEADRGSDEVKKKIAADVAEAAKLGVTGTPAFFVNGRFLSGAQPFPAFQALIDEELGKS